MSATPPSWTRARLAALLGGRLVGPDGPARALRDPREAGREDVVVALRPQFLRASLESEAGLVVVPEGAAPGERSEGSLLAVADAEEAWGVLLGAFDPAHPEEPGVDPRAFVHASAVLADGVHVGPGAVVSAGARIGARSRVLPGAFIGEDAVLGEDCLVRPNATVLHRVSLGDRVIVHPGAVVGADGFGYRRGPQGYQKLAHIGTTVVEDDVEVGANSVIDRSTIGETRIGRGSKIGPSCIVAHNSRLGENVVLIGAVQMAGSVVVEDGAVLMGQVGVAGHLTIGAGATVTAQAGVTKDLPAGGSYRGSPARPLDKALRQEAHAANLATLVERLAALEAEVAALRAAREAGQ
ncbi:MAG TPA: UDP-3-O-(3-hydroxymyristoyl)glucosamine N-acyltransferase [Deinococcales bacterium]|nr:UDP-3-O-(3-hydroxymyristoyl)glucosamine N-acyltransferase [Deinococcales bacterium]